MNESPSFASRREFIKTTGQFTAAAALAGIALPQVHAAASDTIKNHPFFGIFLQQLTTSKARTPHPNWNKIEEIMTNTGTAILAAFKPDVLLRAQGGRVTLRRSLPFLRLRREARFADQFADGRVIAEATQARGGEIGSHDYSLLFLHDWMAVCLLSR